jgi:hypothetical protein
MVRHPDHLTVVVSDARAARAFFALLGSEDSDSTVISGPITEPYMGVPGIEAEVTRPQAHGVKPRNRLMDFHDPKLVFLDGREGITIELAQWSQG